MTKILRSQKTFIDNRLKADWVDAIKNLSPNCLISHILLTYLSHSVSLASSDIAPTPLHSSECDVVSLPINHCEQNWLDWKILQTRYHNLILLSKGFSTQTITKTITYFNSKRRPDFMQIFGYTSTICRPIHQSIWSDNRRVSQIGFNVRKWFVRRTARDRFATGWDNTVRHCCVGERCRCDGVLFLFARGFFLVEAVTPLARRYSFRKWHVERLWEQHAQHSTDDAQHAKYNERQRLWQHALRLRQNASKYNCSI